MAGARGREMRRATNHLTLAALAGAIGVLPAVATGDDPPDDGPSVVSADAGEAEAGPNVGWQPKSPRQAEGDEPAAPEGAEPSRFHFSLGADYTTAYFNRGYNVEDSGWIVQPFADLSLDVIRLDDATISITMGTWNSFQGEATDAGTSDRFTKYWYECDLYAGVGLTAGHWDFQARYYAYTSPSDAFETIEEIYLSGAFDDSELLGAWALQPSAIVAIEVGDVANDGEGTGSYLQLGVAPGFAFDAGSVTDVAVSFPASVGLSLHDYYEGPDGENDVFGYASVGVTVGVPLPIDKSWGQWTLRAGVQGLYLGGVTSEVNDGNHFEVIGTAGVTVEF